MLASDWLFTDFSATVTGNTITDTCLAYINHNRLLSLVGKEGHLSNGNLCPVLI